MCQFLLFIILFLQNHDLNSDVGGENIDVTPMPQKTSINMPAGTKWGYYYFLILNDKNVQKELLLSPSQLADLSKLNEKFFASRNFSKTTKNNPDNSDKNNPAPHIADQSPGKIIGQLSLQAVEVLDEKQKQRLPQIIFQLRKVEIFFYPEITEDFNFTAEQLKEAETTRSWIIDEAKKLHEEYIVKKKDSKQFQKQTLKLLEEGRSRLVKSFSPEQLNKLKEMEGEKIPFNRNDLNFLLRRTNAKDTAIEDK
jgi:hypothetical protein